MVFHLGWKSASLWVPPTVLGLPSVTAEGKMNRFTHHNLPWHSHHSCLLPSKSFLLQTEQPYSHQSFLMRRGFGPLRIIDVRLWSKLNLSMPPWKWCPDLKTGVVWARAGEKGAVTYPAPYMLWLLILPKFVLASRTPTSLLLIVLTVLQDSDMVGIVEKRGLPPKEDSFTSFNWNSGLDCSLLVLLLNYLTLI